MRLAREWLIVLTHQRLVNIAQDDTMLGDRRLRPPVEPDGTSGSLRQVETTGTRRFEFLRTFSLTFSLFFTTVRLIPQPLFTRRVDLNGDQMSHRGEYATIQWAAIVCDPPKTH
jgi:hypothetical protein